MAGKARWVITSDGKRPLPELRKDLEKSGFRVDKALDEIGVLTGDSDEGADEALRKIPGVSDVSRDGDIDIGPPGSSRTW